MPSRDDHDRPGELPIAEPLRPGPAGTPDARIQPVDLAPDGVAFSTRTAGPSKLRIGVITGAGLALAVGAVATSFASSPAPNAASSTTAPGVGIVSAAAVIDPAVDGLGGGFDHDRFGGPGGARHVTVAAISGSNLSLKTEDGWSRTIAVTDSIALTKGGQDIALSDIAVGDAVRFSQTRNDDGTFTVTAIAVVVPSVAGEVSDVTASGFKVTGRDGAVWTITVDGATTYRLGAVDGTKADVTNGASVRVEGESTGDNALKALGVQVAAERTLGTVTAKTATTITITTRDAKTVTVTVNGDTTYVVAGSDPATLSDITVDMVVGVQGATNSDGSIDADAVVAGGRGFGRGMPGMGGGPGFGGPGMGHGGFGGPGWDKDVDGATPSASPSTGS